MRHYLFKNYKLYITLLVILLFSDINQTLIVQYVTCVMCQTSDAGDRGMTAADYAGARQAVSYLRFFTFTVAVIYVQSEKIFQHNLKNHLFFE